MSVKLFSIKGIEFTVSSLLLAVLSLLVAVLLGRLARRGLTRLLGRRMGPGSEGTAYAAGRVVQYLVTAIGILVSLENIGVDFSTLAALGAVLAVGLGFGLQNITQNFVSGLILLLERPMKKGDVVVVDGVYGTVDSISIRATRVMTFDGIALIVPNSKFVSDIVENRSEPTERYRTRIEVHVAYGSNTRDVERILLDIATQHAAILKVPDPVVLFLEFGESALHFQLCVWLDDPQIAVAVSSELRHKIAERFAREGVIIPFPQRDVHLKPAEEA